MRIIRKLLQRIPGAKRIAHWRALATLPSRVPMLHPPGHFYSVLPSFEQIKRDGALIFGSREIRGIDLESSAALELRAAFPQIAQRFPFTESPSDLFRYGSRNGFFSEADAVVLFCFLLHLKPRRVIEVGCGHSTKVLLDTSREFLDLNLRCRLVDPFAENLLRWMSDAERKRHEIHKERVQDLPLSTFEELGQNDILFIDSSHAVKAGSDVNWLLFEVLPRLAPGVIVHIHDIPFPFEYPEDWYHRGFAWNEAYLVRALLQNSNAFEVLWFAGHLAENHREYLEQNMPRCLSDGVSLWIRRTGQIG